MKFIKTASGKKRIKMSRKEWESIGKKAGWMKESAAVRCPKCGKWRIYDYDENTREYDWEYYDETDPEDKEQIDGIKEAIEKRRVDLIDDTCDECLIKKLIEEQGREKLFGSIRIN